jgi:hypothetical protein
MKPRTGRRKRQIQVAPCRTMAIRIPLSAESRTTYRERTRAGDALARLSFAAAETPLEARHGMGGEASTVALLPGPAIEKEFCGNSHRGRCPDTLALPSNHIRGNPP